jgi:hypothetical protein
MGEVSTSADEVYWYDNEEGDPFVLRPEKHVELSTFTI